MPIEDDPDALRAVGTVRTNTAVRAENEGKTGDFSRAVFGLCGKSKRVGKQNPEFPQHGRMEMGRIHPGLIIYFRPAVINLLFSNMRVHSASSGATDSCRSLLPLGSGSESSRDNGLARG
jgi:hypothetical protein